MKVVSVNTAVAKEIIWNTKTVKTGIFKKPTSSIEVTKTGVKNDTVSDTKNHGGFDKAVYGYSLTSYNYFKKHYPTIELNYGSFGENLTFDNLDEQKVYIGDVFKIGETLLQVSQPRFPCYKLEFVFKDENIVKTFLNAPYCGFYFRVLQEGKIQKGDSIELISRALNSKSLSEVFAVYTSKKNDRALQNKILEIVELAEDWKKRMSKKLL